MHASLSNMPAEHPGPDRITPDYPETGLPGDPRDTPLPQECRPRPTYLEIPTMVTVDRNVVPGYASNSQVPTTVLH